MYICVIIYTVLFLLFYLYVKSLLSVGKQSSKVVQELKIIMNFYYEWNGTS